MRTASPERMAARGRVVNHARNIPPMVFHLALPQTLPLIKPMPKREPHETCVVETGIPHLVAKITRNAVTRLAVNPLL